jgi:plasmid stabilization system protein ParE
MEYEMIFSEDFKNSLDKILNYMIFVLDNPLAASALNDELERVTKIIGIFPESFKEKENRPGTRYAIVRNYMLLYSFDTDEMTITFKDIVYAKGKF